jgi:precorrin-2 dehydrogenase/sirohydrochlorin ferrochelatase
MRYYPAFLNLKNRGVGVVGAGEIAWQKIPALLEGEANIRVVAPEAVPEIEALARANKLEWFRRPYNSSDLERASLVIAATDDPHLQEQVAAEARARRIWVNVVDATPLCDFIMPAVVTRGDVQIAVSTGGASPALARWIREKLEPLFGDEYRVLAEVLQRYRPELLKLPKERRQAVWEAIINEDFINRVKREGSAVIESRLEQYIHGKSAV